MPRNHRPAKYFEGIDATKITVASLFILLIFGLAMPLRSSAGGSAIGKIAFTRGSGTAEEIYVMNADGSAAIRVTNNAVRDYFPVISPNGSKIAFESERNGNWDIYVIDPDGTNEQRLTTTPGVDLHAAWSPDGKHIAFSSHQNGNSDIYVMDAADGSNQRRITIHPAPDLHPVYSLDGTRFVFASVRDGDREIFTIASDVTESESEFDCDDDSSCGFVPLRLTDNRAFDSFPAWSPDGTKIVFHSFRDGNFEIYVMGIHGENQTNVTRSPTEDIFPNWSPDGTKIVFESLRGGNRDIYVMDANGNNPTRLTTDAAQDLIPAWHWQRNSDPKTISGRVRGISGGAVGDLKINVRRIADASAIPICVANNTFVRTLTDGTYSIQVTPGCAYNVGPDPQELQDRFATDEGAGVANPPSITVFVAFNVPSVNFGVGATPTPGIRGRIIDASKCPNYNPLTDGNLECGLPGVSVIGEWSGEPRRDVSKSIISTDASISGRYTLPDFLINSVVTVRATLPGYVITIIPPNTEQITLTSPSTRPLVDFRAVLANSNPVVSLTDPANGTTYAAAAPVLINANASDQDGLISKVEFFRGNIKLGEDNTGPYSFTWNPLAAGNYSLTAVATDNGGTSTTSSPVNITVNEADAVQFSASAATATETFNATTKLDLTVTRTGNTSGAASVNYASANGTANERSDYLAALGTVRFQAGETAKTIPVFIVDDSFGESAETFTVTLSSAVGTSLGSPATITLTINSNEAVDGPNPVKDASFSSDFFVRQHYVDFFNREADAPGLAFWKNQIDECTTQQCREIRRINVSAAFYISIEFQQTGYLVYKAYQAAFNSGEQLELRDFLPDTQEIGRGVIIGQPGADQQLETNKQNFFLAFVQRPAFLAPGAY
ncbi:MAG: Ig-like domain-containing protein, partial [Pyrinomonadaceae bacterium]